MPKEIQHISDFSGGNRVVRTIPGTGKITGMDIATSEVDVRDVLDNELVDMIDCEVVEDGKIALTKSWSWFNPPLPEVMGISPGHGLSILNSDYDGAQNPMGFREQNTDLPDFIKSEYILIGNSNDGQVLPGSIKEVYQNNIEWGDVSIGLDDQDLEDMTDFQLEMANVDNAVIISDANFDNDRTSIPAKYGFVNYYQFPTAYFLPSSSEEDLPSFGSTAFWRGFYKGSIFPEGPVPYAEGQGWDSTDTLFASSETFIHFHAPNYLRSTDPLWEGENPEHIHARGGVGVYVKEADGTGLLEGEGFPGYWQFGLSYIYGDGTDWDLDSGVESKIHWGFYANSQGEGEYDTVGGSSSNGLYSPDPDGTDPKRIQARIVVRNYSWLEPDGSNQDWKLTQRTMPAIDKRIIGARVYIREWEDTTSSGTNYTAVSGTEKCLCESRFTQTMSQVWIDDYLDHPFQMGYGAQGSVYGASFRIESSNVSGGIRERGGSFPVHQGDLWWAPWIGGDNISWIAGGDIDNVSGSAMISNVLLIEGYEPLIDTYESINGYVPDDYLDMNSLGDGWKTSTLYSNRFFIANVKNSGTVYPDTIYKGIPGKGASFLRDSYITVASEDADEIVCIKVYNNKLLCFKEKSLYIFDISEFDNEKLEETKHGLGTDHPSSVVETPYGIAWKSSGGIVYLYDGSDVLDLTVNKDSNSVYFTSMWGGNFLQDHQIGYDPSFDELVLISRETEVVDIEDSVMPFSPLLKYKFKNGYWSYTRSFGAAAQSQMLPRGSGGLNNILLPTKGGGGDRDPHPPDIPSVYYPSYDPMFWKKTNLIWTSGSLFGFGAPRAICCSPFKYFGTDYTLVWGLANFPPSLDASPCNRGSVHFEFSTKEFDLGSPDVRKKIYKVYVSYKNPVEQAHEDGGLYPPKLFIALNGKSSHNKVNEDPFQQENEFPNWVSLGEFDGTSLDDEWVRKEFTVKNSLDVPQHDYNKAITVQLKVARSAYPLVDFNEDVNVLTNPGFEVNDMSIVYRTKPVK